MKTRKERAIRYSCADRIFLAFDWVILTLFLIILVYPLLYVVMSSFSIVPLKGLSLIPEIPSLEGYRAVVEYQNIWVGYRNSIVYMACGTAIALLVTVCCAYPLSREDFGGRNVIMALCVFTMYFSGGLIPTFLWIKQLGMLDSIWALIVPPSLSVYNMIVMRTYFKTQIPAELHEAADLDGCNEYRFVLSIVLPLSGPILAVIGLYYAVGLWNGYFDALVYIRTQEKQPLTIFLRQIMGLNQMTGLETGLGLDAESLARAEARAQLMKYSLIIVSSLPVMLLYPFVQKYFVKGVMIGAIKG